MCFYSWLSFLDVEEELFPGVLSSGSIDSCLTRPFLTCKRRESVFTLDYPFWMWKKKGEIVSWGSVKWIDRQLFDSAVFHLWAHGKCFYSWLSFLDVEEEGENCFLGFCQLDRSTVVWLGSFWLVSAGKVFSLLIFLFGRGPWLLGEEGGHCFLGFCRVDRQLFDSTVSHL